VFFASSIGRTFDVLTHYLVDSKAMRKVGDEERLVVVIENSAAFGIEVYHNIRILSKPF